MTLALLLSLLSLASPGPELAFATTSSDCDLKIRNLNNLDFGNDPSPSLTFSVKRDDRRCAFFLTVDNGGAPSFSSRRLLHSNRSDKLGVQICGDAACSTVLKHFPEAVSASDVLQGAFQNTGAEEQRFTLYPRLTPSAYERYGSYESTFTLRLYSGNLTGRYTLEDTDTFRLSHRLEKRIDLSLVSPGSPFDAGATAKTLDFGELTTGKEQSFDLVLKFNAGYKIRISSQNGGYLRSRASKAGIGYSLFLNNVGVAMAGSSDVILAGSGTSPAGGQRFGGRVRIGKVENAQAGTYADAVTFTVSANE